MTGPEHYREAEELLRLVANHPDSSDALIQATAAQAHATLAVAAGLLGTLEEQQISAMLDEKIDQAIRDHVEDSPHIYPDGSTS
jgi:hypothetical protein